MNKQLGMFLLNYQVGQAAVHFLLIYLGWGLDLLMTVQFNLKVWF
jgi:hypothetical protein